MIYPYFSNSYEFLKALLLEQIKTDRAGSSTQGAVFALTEVVVPDEAVKDDLNRALADAIGIASGIRFVTTQAWLDRLNHGSLDVRGRARALEWAIYAVVTDPEFLQKSECRRLKDYVEETTQSAIWPLVSRLAALFTIYAAYRADWLWNWAGVEVPSADKARLMREQQVLKSHPDYLWQKALWMQLCTRQKADGSKLWPTADEFLSIPHKWLERMNTKQGKVAALYLFVPRELPPLALAQLLAESQRRQVHLFMHNPSATFWFDPSVKSTDGFSWFHRNACAKRALIDRVRNFVTQDTASEDRVFLEDDLNQTVYEAPKTRTAGIDALGDVLKLKAEAQQSEDIFLRPGCESFLVAIQAAVLEDDPKLLPHGVQEQDQSFLIVRAPNALREVEALCDWISATIEASRRTDQPLSASDFLVTTPDIDSMAGVIAAVMGSRDESERLSYHIAGQSELDVNGAARAMLAAMRFVGGAATAEEFSELIEMPAFAAIRSSSNINATQIACWLAAAGYRWGLNEKHARSAVRRHLASEEGDGVFEGTLERAIERLVAGNLTAASFVVVAGDVLGMRGTELCGRDSTSDDPDSFGFLLSLAQAFEDVGELPQSQSMDQWLETTRRFADTIFSGYSKSSDMIAFMMRASSLAASAADVLQQQPVSFETWCSALEKTLRNAKTAVRASGRITFAKTGDFAAMPFKCVAVIGLNDGESFPGSSRREEFDLTAARVVIDGEERSVSRRGDRDSRESNRGVFLDLLLAARQHFYVSYSIGSGAVPANPSVVLQDLKQALVEALDEPQDIDAKLTKTVGALAASAENFAVQMGLVQARSPELANAVNKALEAGYIAQEEPFADAALARQTDASLSVDDLAKFFTYAESKSLRILGLADDDNEEAQTAPVVRYGNDDYLYRSRVQRQIYQALELGRSVEQIEAFAACDPTLGEQSVRALLVAEPAKSLNDLHNTLVQKIETMQETSRERFEGGRLVFECARQKPFSSIAVAPVDLYVDAHGCRVAVAAGVSSSDLLKTFLQFAAVNLLAAERKQEAVDFLYVSQQKGKPVESHWRVCLQGDQQQEARNTTVMLRHILKNLLELVNVHVGERPILAGAYVEQQASLVWRGLNGYSDAQKGCAELLKSVEKLIALFDVAASGKSRKSKKDPLEIFDLAIEQLAGLNTGRLA